jgi:hypothetical protein
MVEAIKKGRILTPWTKKEEERRPAARKISDFYIWLQILVLRRLDIHVGY